MASVEGEAGGATVPGTLQILHASLEIMAVSALAAMVLR
jgi:hypothetical protein